MMELTARSEVADDPVLLAIVQKQLDHVSQQMGWVMTRTARSPIFSQSHDFSCFIGNAGGETVAQADGIPIHTGGGGFALRAVLAAFGDELADGDVYILSDPYAAGGNHLPDWTIIRPVFVAGRHVAFACNRAHQSDIGGGAAGTYNAAATEIFHEGIRLPVLKLYDRGTLRKDVWRLLLLNSRCPDLVEGDLGAMLGSTQIGAERIAQLLRELGANRGPAYLDAVLDYAERRMRSAIRDLPDGSWQGEDVSDTDCFRSVDVPVRVTVTVAGDEMIFDFTGTAPQVRGFKNSSLANTHSAVYLAVSSFLDPAIPRNEGTYRPVRIVAPQGTVVNARPPAPMTMNTMYPAIDIVNACWKALAQADPSRACAGWGKTAYTISAGTDRGGDFFVLYHWHGASAAGAVKGRDGFHTIGHCATLGGLTIPNVETYEQSYPIRIERNEFRRDTAGAGEFRGGAGVDYAAEISVPTEHSVRAEGGRKPTGFGVNGGQTGAGGRLGVYTPDGQEIETPQYCMQQLGPKRVTVESPAGGGWGDPRHRNPAAVLRDVRDGLVSPEMARDTYGVALTADGKRVDENATEALRRS